MYAQPQRKNQSLQDSNYSIMLMETHAHAHTHAPSESSASVAWTNLLPKRNFICAAHHNTNQGQINFCRPRERGKTLQWARRWTPILPSQHVKQYSQLEGQAVSHVINIYSYLVHWLHLVWKVQSALQNPSRSLSQKSFLTTNVLRKQFCRKSPLAKSSFHWRRQSRSNEDHFSLTKWHRIWDY